MKCNDGHEGPIEIGCGKEFTDWLTDPKLNGGGAVIDFGCYGANLVTWLMNGERPKSVYAILKQLKPDKYPKVDDDATILVEYPSATVQIMGSWNWRRDGKICIFMVAKDISIRILRVLCVFIPIEKKKTTLPPKLKEPYNDSFYYLKAAVRKEIQVQPYDLSSLENNLIVVEILESAIKSAKSGKPVRF